MEPIISVNDLQKEFKVAKHHRGRFGAVKNFFSREYNIVHAVDHINFKINPGELVGYLGPNGAGKSTTLKMLTGLLVPTAGDVLVNEFVPWKDRKKYVAQIGAVFGQRTTLWWDLPVIESLELLQHIYNIPKSVFDLNLQEFTDLLDLKPFLDTPVRSLSLGQRMRADICAALIHNPKLLFLDEPTIGLDVVAKERIRQFIKHINQDRGTTILLTTHDLNDVEKLCKRIIIIDEGQILFDDDLSLLKKRFGGKRQLIVDFAEDYQNVEINGAKLVSHDQNRAHYQFERTAITASELINRVSQKFRIIDIEVREPEIEETVRRIYENRLLKK